MSALAVRASRRCTRPPCRRPCNGLSVESDQFSVRCKLEFQDLAAARIVAGAAMLAAAGALIRVAHAFDPDFRAAAGAAATTAVTALALICGIGTAAVLLRPQFRTLVGLGVVGAGLAASLIAITTYLDWAQGPDLPISHTAGGTGGAASGYLALVRILLLLAIAAAAMLAAERALPAREEAQDGAAGDDRAWGRRLLTATVGIAGRRAGVAGTDTGRRVQAGSRGQRSLPAPRQPQLRRWAGATTPR